jgi:formylglycine-generating enzyme required for sulfatase activity
MRKWLVSALLLSAVLPFAIWQHLSIVAEVGSVAALEVQKPVASPPSITDFTFVEKNAQGYLEYTHDSSGIRFVRLPGGSFSMGSLASEPLHDANAVPVHTVSLSPFLITKYEVTQAQYEAVMTGHEWLEATPSFRAGPNLPVEQVSWLNLHEKDGFLRRTGLALPSEAQWEYACRAGTSGPYAGTGKLDDMGWYTGNSGSRSGGHGQTHDVGSKKPNQFGLHDLHGNLWEWCVDRYDPAFYSKPAATQPDPVATLGSDRVVRGGSFDFPAVYCRSPYRSSSLQGDRSKFIGVRLVRTLP